MESELERVKKTKYKEQSTNSGPRAPDRPADAGHAESLSLLKRSYEFPV